MEIMIPLIVSILKRGGNNEKERHDIILPVRYLLLFPPSFSRSSPIPTLSLLHFLAQSSRK